MASLVNCTKHLKNINTSQILPKKLKWRVYFLTHSEASITLVTQPQKDITTKLQTNIPFEHWFKNPQQNQQTELSSKNANQSHNDISSHTH